jgi:hypothetical protein
MQKNHLENVVQCHLKYHHLESGNILKPVKTSRCGHLPPSLLQVRAAEERRRKAKRCRGEICRGGIELVGGLEH